VKKLESKAYTPKGGWNAETYEKHGTTLISNFFKSQINHRRKGQIKLKKFLERLFNNQIEEVIEGAVKSSSFKQFGIFDPWVGSLSRTFMQGDFQVAGNLKAIQEPLVNGTYGDSKKLLGEKVPRHSKFRNRERSNKIAGRVTKINKTTRTLLKQEIQNALKEGLSVAETSKKLREMLPRMNRRIPTIVRTEMGRATDEGVKQALKESRVVTHCSVMGCEKEEPLFTYNGQSTCNVEGVPIGEVDGVEFHINHTGAWVPSRFKSAEQIRKDNMQRINEQGRINPTRFPSKPRAKSRDSKDAHTRGGIFNESRRSVHQKIKNQITGNQTETGWKGVPAVLLFGGAILSAGSTRENQAFKNNNPKGRLGESIDINGEFILEEFPEFKPMVKASRMGSFEQSQAYLLKETMFLKEDLMEECIQIGLTIAVEGINSGRVDNYKKYYENLKANGHKLEGHFSTGSLSSALHNNVKLSQAKGLETPSYFIERAIENSVEVLTIVSRGVFNKFYIYHEDEIIFKYAEDNFEIYDMATFQDYIFGSRHYSQMAMQGEDLPFLKNKDITSEININTAKNTSDEPDARDCKIMAIEIITGVDKKDSDLHPMNEEYSNAWALLKRQVANLEDNGSELSFHRHIDT